MKDDYMHRVKVEVSGVGCICSAGLTTSEVMQSLYAGKRVVGKSSIIKSTIENEYPVFEINSDLETLLGKACNDATRTTKLAYIAVIEALEQAQLSGSLLKRLKVGVCLGTTVGTTLNDENFYRAFLSKKYPDIKPVVKFRNNNPGLYISNIFKLDGPVITVTNACSSSADAIGIAKSWIENGQCDVAIAGGTDELSRITYLGFISLMITAKEACRPFDLNRTGLNLGEGAGIVILENAELLQKRKVTSLGQIVGYANCSDAHHLTGPHPDGEGLRRAIKQIIDYSGIEVEQVGFVNAHGTSTPDNDRIEGTALKDLMPHRPPVVSTKAYTGHTLGAAGGIEAVLTIQALLDQKLPATAGFVENDQECGITPTTVNTPVTAEYALSNSLAFGGTNSVLLLGRTE